MSHLGLRARVTAAFAVGAALLATAMALFSYDLTRRALLEERERTAVRAAYFDAVVVRAGLDTETPDVAELLGSLATGKARRPLLQRNGSWYARSAEIGARSVPVELRRMVQSGTPAVQRVRRDGQPILLVGVPISATASYYELTSLREVEQTCRSMALTLTAVAIMIAGTGAALGWYATRHSLRPLTAVADVAERIADGELGTRLDTVTDPDLTRLSASFNRMVEQLIRHIERDRRFAAVVSHELRSPLQTLAAAASVLERRREHHDDRTRAAAGLVVDEITRFERLVDDLIELARTEQPAQREFVDIVALAREACRTHGIPEEVIEPPDIPEWTVDRRRVGQILLNLVENAVRYGGGPVTVRLGCADGTGIVEVDDAGPGVPVEDQERVFDRFVRGRAANDRGDTAGTGLGLALVAEHAVAHGGRALVTDRPQGGARFRVELPGCVDTSTGRDAT